MADKPKQMNMFDKLENSRTTLSSVTQKSLLEKNVPEMPEGYYSGDKPNPNLRAFVERHIAEHPYDPETDDYDVPPFDKPIETTKATAIYNMHTYWSKKPHDAIRQYIRHYTKPGDLVLDPFCGSGGTALAALMEGRKAIAIDRSPAATFITKNYCTPVDVDELKAAFEELKAKVQPEIDWLYETRCERCGGKASITYIVYSHVYQCPRCMKKISRFECVDKQIQTVNGDEKKISACSYCLENGIVEEIPARGEKFGVVPVLTSYICENGCKPSRGIRRFNDNDDDKKDYFIKYDIAKIDEINSKNIPHWYPHDTMLNVSDEIERWGLLWRPYHGDIRRVDQFFEKRTLWALSSIMNYINNNKYDSQLKFAFNSCVLGLSKMLRESNTAIMEGVLYMPPVYKEIHALNSFMNKGKSIYSGLATLRAIQKPEINISCQNACDLYKISSNSIDYIFTDPPYSDKRQYGELNFIWESWLNFNTSWHDQEIIVNEVRNMTEADWASKMKLSLAECYRVLKPGRWLSLCYHDTSEGTWELVQDIMAECGFISDSSDSAVFIDVKQKSIKQRTADKVNKRDLVINFRKPNPGEVAASVSLTGQEDATTFADKAHRIIRDYLEANPGSTKDRVYDEVVSRMVRSGQMEAHDFDALLRQVADEITVEGEKGPGRWYLKEAELTTADEAETAREDNAAAKLEAFIKKYLRKTLPANPDPKLLESYLAVTGVHYSNLFEHYIYAVKDKPRRQLTDILPDYFYKTDDGTWRFPTSDEERAAKAKARAAGLGRRVKRYLALLETGAAIPEQERQSDATLAEWLRYCKRAGLFAQGRLLYEKGGLNTDNLPEEIMVGVEEDYQVCMLMLNKESPAPKKRGKKAS